MVRLRASRNAGNEPLWFNVIMLLILCHTYYMLLSLFLALSALLYFSDVIVVGSLLLQVWYPSLGADPFKQEDFLQVRMCFSRGFFI